MQVERNSGFCVNLSWKEDVTLECLDVVEAVEEVAEVEEEVEEVMVDTIHTVEEEVVDVHEPSPFSEEA